MSNEISALLNKLNPRTGVQSGSAAETADSKPPRGGTTADGSKITDVDEAVRYIKTVVARDENAIARIRRMKNNQAEHEAQWYQRRLELLEKHKARREGRKKLAEMLQRIGGDASTAPSEEADLEAEQADLRVYDQKVYNAQMAMLNSLSLELGDLGIPFFGGKISDPGEDEGADEELVQNRRIVLDILDEISR